MCLKVRLFWALASFSILFFACGKPTAAYRGVSLVPVSDSGIPSTQSLKLTLNVGILNDSQFSELRRQQVENFLLGQFEKIFPYEREWETAKPPIRLQLDFIVDQPMNIVFALNETYMSVAAQTDFAEETRALSLTNEALSSSLRVWQLYLGQQVRYDIIFTNASIEDAPVIDEVSGVARGGAQAWLLPTLARQSLENFGVLLTTGGTNDLDTSVDLWKRHMQALIFLTKPLDLNVLAHAQASEISQQLLAREFTLEFFSLLQRKSQWNFFPFSRVVRIPPLACQNLINHFSQPIKSWERISVSDSNQYKNKNKDVKKNRIRLLDLAMRNIAEKRIAKIFDLTDNCNEQFSNDSTLDQ